MWCKCGAVCICVWQRSPLLTSSALSNTQSMSWCPTSGGTTSWGWCGSASSSLLVSSLSSPALLLSGTLPGGSCVLQLQSSTSILVNGGTFFFFQYGMLEWLLYTSMPRAGIACWWECRTRDQKVASLNPGRSSGKIFFSRVLFGVGSTPVLPQWHVKDPGHSAKNAGGRLHLNTHTPLTHQSWGGLTMPLSRQS